ncbi:MAG: UDP-N-acetylglucosamine 2-epimerase (non-hydrolyzing) [Armatimonadetes bacterium]|nr:UDP-N-acetylglucosamine 2-epimerase (non-hydrolyzing) [Armatimonadota bacterium]
MKIVSVVGARPQFIKASQLSIYLRKRHREILLHTGQHYNIEMSNIFFKELKIPKPDYNLGIGSGAQGYQVGKMILGIEKALMKEKPDLVIVYGDTNSTLAGAIAAKKNNFPLAHIEAGLRSFTSIPEEINRVITDRISDILFCPTKGALLNLKKENIKKKIYFSGDIMLDVLKYNLPLVKKEILNRWSLFSKKYLLLTLHRAENVDNFKILKKILDTLLKIKEKIIFPVHPRTKNKIKENNYFLKIKNSNLILTKPLSYLEILALEKEARLILTDSGGIQKEAYFLGVPCITLRKVTEWVETVKSGWNILVGSDSKKILSSINFFNPQKKRASYFGDGYSYKKILKILENWEETHLKS